MFKALLTLADCGHGRRLERDGILNAKITLQSLGTLREGIVTT